MRRNPVARSWWRIPLTLLFQAVLLLLLAIFWVLGTQSGLRFALSLVDELAPDRFRVERGDGRVLGDLHLEGLSVRTPGLALRLGSLDLRWTPLAALIGTLPISEFSVRGLDIATAPSKGAKKEGRSGPIELPQIRLPIRIELARGLVERLSIGTLDEDSRFRADRIELAASWSDSTLTLKGLTLVLPESEPRAGALFTADGKLDLSSPAGKVDLNAAWKELRWPLAGRPVAESGWGELQVRGTLDKLDYRLSSEVKGPNLPAAELQLTGSGNREATRIGELRLKTLGGQLQGTADVAWKPSVTWDAELAIADLDPGRQWPEWRGILDGRILSKGKLAAGGPEFSARIESLAGELQGYPVDAVAGIRMRGTELRIDELRVASGPSNLEATGSVGERLDLALDLDVPDLENLLPDAQGSLRASGTLTGTPAAPALKLELAAGGIAVAEQRIQSLGGTVQVDLAAGGPVRIDLTGQDLAAGGMVFDGLRVRGSGNTGAHRLFAEVIGAPLALDLEVTGGLKADYAYAGRLTGLALRTPEFGNWRLQKAAPIRLAGARINAGPLCIREEAGSGGCASFARQEAGSWSAVLDLDRLTFGLFQDFIPEDLVLEGEATAKADFRAVGETLIGNAQVRIPKGVLNILSKENKARPEPLNFTSTQLVIDADGKGLRARLAVPMKGLGDLSAEVALPGWDLDQPARPNQPLQGGVRARIDDFGRLAHLVPDITQLTGNLKADLKLGGTFAEPGLDGSARVAGGGLEVPFIGLKVEDLAFKAVARGLDRVEYSGGFKAGDGTLEIEGRTLVDAAGVSTRIRAKANRRLTVADSKEYFVLATPDIAVEIEPTGTKITGTVWVPKARIRPRHIPAGTVSSSPDVVISAKGREEKTSRYATRIDLRLVLGKKVTIDAFGLEGRLQGELTILQEPGKEILGDGQLEIVDGTYRVDFVEGLSGMLGEPLTIEQGVLNYAKSPLHNPLLVLTAQREDDDITAGLRVFGTIRNPKMTLELFLSITL